MPERAAGAESSRGTTPQDSLCRLDKKEKPSERGAVHKTEQPPIANRGVGSPFFKLRALIAAAADRGALTVRQVEVLDMIENFIAIRGFSPTLQEIAGHFAVSAKCIRKHVSALELAGWVGLDRARGPRGIRLRNPDRRGIVSSRDAACGADLNHPLQLAVERYAVRVW